MISIKAIANTVLLGVAIAISLSSTASASSEKAFKCPVPVIPSDFGPSNACCNKLVKIPLSSLVNPEDGAVYWGLNCTKAEVEEEIGDGSTQAVTYPCAEDMSAGCCDPTFMHYAGSGPCTMPLDP